ncbi:hypothetical protein Taro_024151 [Colocasia esculenta]|uniref:Uncharacterized protein n=1 Tax=Colocasia esculenta TaxID=4460 RepID=A0A843V5N9_COLES|nr:hypothetical protein [Colocasia esculenta]
MYGGLPTSGRTTPPSRGWSRAVPTSVGTFRSIASTRWFRSTTGWWRALWDSTRSRTGRSRSGSSWTTGSGEGRRWSLRLPVTRTTSGLMPGSTGPRCTRGPDDRLTLRDGSPRSRASSIPLSSSETTSRRWWTSCGQSWTGRSRWWEVLPPPERIPAALF